MSKSHIAPAARNGAFGVGEYVEYGLTIRKAGCIVWLAMRNATTIHLPMQGTGGVVVMLRGRRASWYATKPNSTGKQEESI